MVWFGVTGYHLLFKAFPESSNEPSAGDPTIDSRIQVLSYPVQQDELRSKFKSRICMKYSPDKADE